MKYSNPIQVYVLIDDDHPPNEDYYRIFERDHRFDCPIFSSSKYPSGDWVNGLSERDSVELYNHYRLWVQSVEENRSILVLSNSSYPVESDKLTKEGILASCELPTDLVLFGKYLDQCDRYKYQKTLILSDCDRVKKFPIYQTGSPYGFFAYLINPEGARKLIHKVYDEPLPVELLMNRAIECGLKTFVYHPSIIRINDPHHEMFCYECREPQIKPNCITWSQIFWAVVLVIVIILFLGLILYLALSRFPSSSDQVINSGYTKCPKQKTTDCLPNTLYAKDYTAEQIVQSGYKPVCMK